MLEHKHESSSCVASVLHMVIWVAFLQDCANHSPSSPYLCFQSQFRMLTCAHVVPQACGRSFWAVVCFVSNHCWGRFGSALGVIIGVVALIAGLLLLLKLGLLGACCTSLLAMCGGCCGGGGKDDGRDRGEGRRGAVQEERFRRDDRRGQYYAGEGESPSAMKRNGPLAADSRFPGSGYNGGSAQRQGADLAAFVSTSHSPFSPTPGSPWGATGPNGGASSPGYGGEAPSNVRMARPPSPAAAIPRLTPEPGAAVASSAAAAPPLHSASVAAWLQQSVRSGRSSLTRQLEAIQAAMLASRPASSGAGTHSTRDARSAAALIDNPVFNLNK